ncbi:hypothetical protein [Parachlamydia acanthamoebae]|uniref:hypothetical protein n=1 Tax=Parachlamydia acanthamoebae TaxID=83552 RepID=UPI000750F0F5|nr:hypothetical protein [Parachlamydia acanthamoebae]
MSNHISLLSSPPPIEMDDWAKNKIIKTAYLKTNTNEYSLPTEEASLLVYNFAHVIFKNFYSQLYQKHPLPLDKEIVVMTQVLTDGVGDYYHALSTSEAIKKSFPNQQVLMIPVFCSDKQLEGISLPTKFDCCVVKSGESCQKDVIERIKKSLFILEIPWEVDIFHSREISNAKDEMKSEKRYVFVNEYGSRRIGMGLDYYYDGIFIKDMPSNSSLINLKDDILKSCLFERTALSEGDVEKYFYENELFFSYIHTNKKIMRLFLYSATFSQFNQSKNIDICSYLDPLDSEIDYQFLKEQGIAGVEFISKEGNKLVSVKKKLAEQGKFLRLINLFPMPQKDVHALMVNSHMMIGCTGDQSFTEAVSFNKLPFYEMRTFKQMFFMHYRRITQYELDPEEKEFKKYLDQIFKTVNINNYSEEKIKKRAIKIGRLVNTRALFEEAQKMNLIIQKRFSFHDNLKGIIAQQIFRDKFPEFSRFENKIISLIARHKIVNFQEIWDLLNQKAQELLHLE